MLTAVSEVMRRCYEKNWITTRDGNLSLRKKDSNILYITPSGVRKNVIRVEDMIKLKIEQDQLIIPEGKTPSGELHMHWLLQSVDNSKTLSVLHVHATNIIAAMYAGWKLSKIAQQFPEVNRYTRVGPIVPFLPAISKELGDATFTAMTKDSTLQYDIVGQDRHGVCAIARHPWEAYEHCERLDHVCEIILKSGIRPF